MILDKDVYRTLGIFSCSNEGNLGLKSSLRDLVVKIYWRDISFGALTEPAFSTPASLSLGILIQKLAYPVRKTKF